MFVHNVDHGDHGMGSRNNAGPDMVLTALIIPGSNPFEWISSRQTASHDSLVSLTVGDLRHGLL
jgi:hypothetical protein